MAVTLGVNLTRFHIIAKLIDAGMSESQAEILASDAIETINHFNYKDKSTLTPSQVITHLSTKSSKLKNEAALLDKAIELFKEIEPF